MRWTGAVVTLLTMCLQIAPAAAARAECGGRNILSDIATTDRTAYERIVARSDAIENGRAIFWKIERDGLAPSYLFGTVHLTDRRVTQLTPPVQFALGAAQVLLIENMDFSAEATSTAYASVMKLAVYSDGRSLDQFLSPQEFAKVVQATGGMPAEIVKLYRPWMVSLLLAASQCERERIKAGHDVLDLAIARRAKDSGTHVAGLESTTDQIRALASVPDDEQIGILRANLSLIERSDDLRETMVQLYLDRRISALWDLQLMLSERVGVPASSYASFERVIILERNARMSAGALAYLAKGGVFVAVGALHLPGKTGLVELFREAGYTLTPIE